MLPSLPNAPLQSIDDKTSLAPMRLRKNDELQFMENEAFDSRLIDYKFYENNQSHSIRFKKHMKEVFSLIANELKVGDKIVEVGCGKGDFVEMVQNDGRFEVIGFDAAYDGENASIETRYLTDKDHIKADMVVLRHVLEHIHKPFDFLEMLYNVFGNAAIYIEVPNLDWILENQTFFDITFEHVNYFSPQSIKNLFEKAKSKHGLFFENQYQYIIGDISNLNQNFRFQYNEGSWQYKSFKNLFPRMLQKIQNMDDIAKVNLFIFGVQQPKVAYLQLTAKKWVL